MKQCKDIPDLPILKYLAAMPVTNGHREQCFSFEPQVAKEQSIWNAMPSWVNFKLVTAKMAQLIRRGLVDGCACGCRGDFVITEKGLKTLEEVAE